MPVNIIPEICATCGTEVTVYVRASFCGQAIVFILTASCLGCEDRKASEEPKAP
jgi:hypothetical protein